MLGPVLRVRVLDGCFVVIDWAWEGWRGEDAIQWTCVLSLTLGEHG